MRALLAVALLSACGTTSHEMTPKCNDGAACDDGDAGTSADRCEAGVCAGTAITCDAPPAPACTDATTLRTYAASGTCSAGACGYSYTDEACANGCAAGACE